MKLSESGLSKGTNPAIFYISIIIIAIALAIGAFLTESAGEVVNTAKDWVLAKLKWYYIGTIAVSLLFIFLLFVTRYGNLRLGDDSDRPEFGNFAWIAMIFSAGIAIGLLFWGVAEPIYHFQSNPFIDEGMTPEAAQVAMRLTFFHWGLGGWVTYVIVGLSLAYFSYRKKLPLTMRTALHPILGSQYNGFVGYTVDVLAIFATIFGIATSLGLGAQQLNTALTSQFGIPNSDIAQTVLIAIMVSLAAFTVVSGVNRGIKYLSLVNITLSVVMLAIVLAFGPTRYLLQTLFTNIGDYLSHLIPLTLWIDPVEGSQWQDWWTTFYWAWWIAWAPFVGMFIARISRGRTIREFIVGVLLIPTLMCFVWMSFFGNTALDIELSGAGGIADAVGEDVTVALFVTLDKITPQVWTTISVMIAIVLIVTFFITSSDSATLVVTTIMGGGNLNPPTQQRIIWSALQGVAAAVLLYAGGLKALQTASIMGAMPFALIMILIIIGFAKAMFSETVGPQYAKVESHQQQPRETAAIASADFDETEMVQPLDLVEQLKHAASQGDDEAMVSLGNMYLDGKHIRRNLKEAFRWYQRATEKDNVDAQFRVASMYEMGFGTSKNIEQARYWYEMAAERGSTRAARRLKRLPPA